MIINFKNIDAKERIKVDLKDKKILQALSVNARTPYTRIAKQVGLSKDSVKYRISRMERLGLIHGYSTTIDSSLLGYDTFHLFLKLTLLNNAVRKEIISRLKELQYVKAVLEFVDRYDLEISFIARNVREADWNSTQIMDIAGKYLHESELLIITDFYVQKMSPDGFIKNKERISKVRKDAKVDIDAIDLNILAKISDNATIPLYEIAEEVKLTPEAVKYRLKKLIETGVIKSFVPIINDSAIGYSVYALMLSIQNLSKGKEKTLSYFMKSNPHIIWCAKTIGKYNVIAYICVENNKDFFRTISSLRELFVDDIKFYETMIAYQSHKYTLFPRQMLSNG